MTSAEIRRLVLKLARENTWGYGHWGTKMKLSLVHDTTYAFSAGVKVGLPVGDSGQKKFNWCPVTPTRLANGFRKGLGIGKRLC
jgi:hypothetical protein